MRNISAPASLSGAPLAELKRWLSITATGEDQLLTGLIAAALALCERFTGIVPLKTDVRETIASSPIPRRLSATPHISLLEAVAVDGLQRRLLAPSEYALTVDTKGSASFALLQSLTEPRVELHYLAGIATEWSAIDEGLRHGIVLHAAHLYRERERGPGAQLPASIAALWRPWRELRL